jgi:hypothetical protein
MPSQLFASAFPAAAVPALAAFAAVAMAKAAPRNALFGVAAPHHRVANPAAARSPVNIMAARGMRLAVAIGKDMALGIDAVAMDGTVVAGGRRKRQRRQQSDRNLS